MTALCIGLGRPLQIIGIVRTAHTEPAATPIQGVSTAPSTGPSKSPTATGKVWTGSRISTTPGCTALATPPATPAAADPIPAEQPAPHDGHLRHSRAPASQSGRTQLIQLLQVTGPTVVFAGVDLVDGTPVMDLKPYVTHFDQPPGNRDAAGSTSSPSATAPHPSTSPDLSHQPDGQLGNHADGLQNILIWTATAAPNRTGSGIRRILLVSIAQRKLQCVARVTVAPFAGPTRRELVAA